MDRRSWPWKKKASEKSTVVIESAADASHSQVEKVLFWMKLVLLIVWFCISCDCVLLLFGTGNC